MNTRNILVGYLLTFGWVFLVLGLTLALKRAANLDDEVSRKIVHVTVAFAWIPMYFRFGATVHLLVPPAAFVLLNWISYRKDLFAAMERSDAAKKSPGTVYYALSMLVMSGCCLWNPTLLPCYGAALFCMALGDGFAPYFGAIRKGNRPLFGGRTLYGSLSVFGICLLVLAGFNLLFALGLTLWQIPLIALAAVGLELIGLRGLDNLTLPLGVFFLTAVSMR